MKKTRFNQAFIDEISRIFNQNSEETERFFASYDQPRSHGIRLNKSKTRTNPDFLLKIVSDWLSKILPFWQNSWLLKPHFISELKTLSNHVRIGKTAAHASGLVYLQEPSAMQSVSLLQGRIPPGANVLDLCAAPGGKTTQLIDLIDSDAWMIANEPNRERAQILSENVERWGHNRVIVTQAEPHDLSARFPSWFDVIVVDAPCSGEGMFRKDEQAIEEWSVQNVQTCTIRQKEILRDALKLLSSDGYLLYSTCTFNRQENEDQITWLLQQDTSLQVIEQKRIWPHQTDGEGHFVALLKRNNHHERNTDLMVESTTMQSRRIKKNNQQSNADKAAEQALKEWQNACSGFLSNTLLNATIRSTQGEAILYGDHLYWMPQPHAQKRLTSELRNGLKIIRPGMQLGTKKGKHWLPAHSLALSIQMVEEINRPTCEIPFLNLQSTDPRASAYFRGESISLRSSSELKLSGWCLIVIDRLPAGWVKCSDGIAKNHYPHGLRFQLSVQSNL